MRGAITEFEAEVAAINTHLSDLSAAPLLIDVELITDGAVRWAHRRVCCLAPVCGCHRCALRASDGSGGEAGWHLRFILARPAGSQLQRRDGPGRAKKHCAADERDMKARYAGCLKGAESDRSVEEAIRSVCGESRKDRQPDRATDLLGGVEQTGCQPGIFTAHSAGAGQRHRDKCQSQSQAKRKDSGEYV